MNIEEQHIAPPRLYSKRVIYTFSVLFSTIFGTVILMSNLKETGNLKARNTVLFFGISYTLITLLLPQFITMTTSLTIVANVLGAGILNEYFWNKYLGNEIEFEKKSWKKPAMISLAITIPFVLALVLA
ncbi:hypothetical protein [Salegentibacter chungangensis]|uniref:GtrA-like protein domain-containing protein n=1 Tax=Salegentibacter chungangensis TaxID=1335724 RepID=A0ABW3NT72_9FLAO